METKTQDLTVSGDRQSGKSYLACLAALHAAQAGENVLFECSSMGEMRTRWLDLQAMTCHLREEPYKVWLANGDERMTWANGGTIRMLGPNDYLSCQARVDLYVVDGGIPRVVDAARSIVTRYDE